MCSKRGVQCDRGRQKENGLASREVRKRPSREGRTNGRDELRSHRLRRIRSRDELLLRARRLVGSFTTYVTINAQASTNRRALPDGRLTLLCDYFPLARHSQSHRGSETLLWEEAS